MHSSALGLGGFGPSGSLKPTSSFKSLGHSWLRWYCCKAVFSSNKERALCQQVMEVRISTQGAFGVTIDDQHLVLKHDASRKVIAMLVLSDNHTCERETMAGTLWPDTTRTKSLANLRQTIFQLRKSLHSVCDADALINSDSNTVSLSDCTVSVDINAIIDTVKNHKPINDLQKLQQSITRGLLSDISDGSDLHSEWIASCEKTFSENLKSALTHSLDSIDSIDTKLQYAQLLSTMDPSNELACRTEMIAHQCNGEQGKALKCYAKLWNTLEDEFDIEPSSATQELAVAIKLGEFDATDLKSGTIVLSQSNNDPEGFEGSGGESESEGRSGNSGDSGDSGPEQKQHNAIVPRIAVVPFVGRGVTKEQQVIGEVLADDLINIFSKCNTISVISRLSSSVFSGIAGIQQTINMLQVQYLMTGSYRVTSDQIILDVEFSCSGTSAILWQKRFTGSFNEFLNADHPFVEDALHGMGVSVMGHELRKTAFQPLDRLEDYTLLIGAIAQMHRLTKDSFKRSKRLFDTLIQRNPNHALPYAYLSMWYVLLVMQGWSDSPHNDGEIAFGLSSTALDLDPFLSLGFTLHGFVSTNLRKDLELGEVSYTTALEHNQSDSLAWLLRGTLHAFKGEGEKAVSYTSRAMSISPFDPHRYFYYSLAASAALSANQFDKAINLAKQSLRLNKEHASTLRALTIALWLDGKHTESKNVTNQLLKIQPNLSTSSWLRDTPCAEYPISKDFAEALRLSGVPE